VQPPLAATMVRARPPTASPASPAPCSSSTRPT